MISPPEHPNLLVIGAQKAGTTTLHRVLAEHPAIFMSSPMKEPAWFCPDEYLLKTIGRYRMSRHLKTRAGVLEEMMLQGYAGQQIFGESSTIYTFVDQPAKMALASRIRERSPRCKFVYIVRNPFERIISNYSQIKKRNLNLTWEEFCGSELLDDAVLTSRYHHQLRPYLELFGRENIHALLFEKFVQNQASEANRICQFLGIEAAPFTSQISNQSPGRKADTVFSPFVLETFYEDLVADVRQFETSTGLDTQWNLDFERWSRSPPNLAR